VLEELRLKAGWSKVVLAKRARVDRKTYWRATQGLPVSRDTLNKLAAALTVTPEALLLQDGLGGPVAPEPSGNDLPEWLQFVLDRCEPESKWRVLLPTAVKLDMEGGIQAAVEICQRLSGETSPHDVLRRSCLAIQLASCFEHQGSIDQGLTVIESALKLHYPHDLQEMHWWARFQRGRLWLCQGQKKRKQAREELEAVYRQAPVRSCKFAALHQLGVIDLKEERLDEAEKKFRCCLEWRHQSDVSHRLAYEHRRLGQVYAKMGKACAEMGEEDAESDHLERARGEFEAALAIAELFGFRRYVEEIQNDVRRYRLTQ
jgi:transcriptional regulator with XRE-family HTH domain